MRSHDPARLQFGAERGLGFEGLGLKGQDSGACDLSFRAWDGVRFRA